MKAGWIAVALLLGVSLGVWISYERGESSPAESAADTGAASHVPQSPPSGATPGKFGHRPLQPGTPEPPATNPPATVPGSQQPEYQGYQLDIDLGPVFRRHFEQEAAAGNENSLALAHRELEREVRDDSWAYAIEAEIESSLISETSLGHFQREVVECRATMCEILLSGAGDQQETYLQNFNEGISGKPWSSRLTLTHSATITEDGKVNALMIFRKANPPAAQ